MEPQFIYLINGGEVARVIGYNFEKIEKTARHVVEAHSKNEFGYYGSTGKTWERFYDAFDKWSRYGENDRDSFRAKYESNSDQHRGPGTPNPWTTLYTHHLLSRIHYYLKAHANL